MAERYILRIVPKKWKNTSFVRLVLEALQSEVARF